MKTNKLRILICEDELIVAEYVKETLEANDYEVVGVVKSREEAITTIQFEKPDLVLLDINMDEPMSGVKIAEFIKQYQLPCSYIFITAFNDVETLERAIATEPQAYLVKPLDKATLLANIVLAEFKRKVVSQNESKIIQLQTETGVKEFQTNQLIYVESAANYCEFIFAGKKRSVERLSLSSALTQFNGELIRIHKSYLVNPSFIHRFTSLKVILHDGTALPIGRIYKEEIKNILSN